MGPQIRYLHDDHQNRRFRYEFGGFFISLILKNAGTDTAMVSVPAVFHTNLDYRLWSFHVFGFFACSCYMTPISMVLSVVYLLVGYAFVYVIDFARIKRIPTDEALKKPLMSPPLYDN